MTATTTPLAEAYPVARIVRLREAGWDVFEAFFRGPAFDDNPYWRSCYCTAFDKPYGHGFSPADKPTGKAYARHLIETGVMDGYLAYDADGRAIGWLNANDKAVYRRSLPGDTPVPGVVRAAVCFVVVPAMRRLGVATALLRRAVDDARSEGFSRFEGYPSARASTAAGNYHGPAALYERLGFRAETVGRRVVMAKELGQY